MDDQSQEDKKKKYIQNICNATTTIMAKKLNF